MAGKARVGSMDYSGAIEAFEKALEVNPRSASAHFELACLFDQKESDPAAAIYHYDSYLRLRPEAGNADVVKQRTMTCKQELARNVSLGPLTERQQRELEQLALDNKTLAEQNKQLKEELDKWRAYAARLPAPTNNAPASAPSAARGATLMAAAQPPPTSSSTSAAPASRVGRTPVPEARVHIVKAGETLATIARAYGIKVDALQQANPGLNPRRMQVGQSVTLPGS